MEQARKIVGLRLNDIYGLIYVPETPDFSSPQQLQLIFSCKSESITIKGGADGATLELFNSPMQESDLGEFGKQVIMNLSSFQQYKGYIAEKRL
ncbi:hypothetical protein [Kosakonia sacchari]|uniref:hypothetical protein n=1 Tax=Kosakonia sacchari TaxID=1158459 RepID=UPI003F57010A